MSSSVTTSGTGCGAFRLSLLLSSSMCFWNSFRDVPKWNLSVADLVRPGEGGILDSGLKLCLSVQDGLSSGVRALIHGKLSEWAALPGNGAVKGFKMGCVNKLWCAICDHPKFL
jgi:hypothetical protein